MCIKRDTRREVAATSKHRRSTAAGWSSKATASRCRQSDKRAEVQSLAFSLTWTVPGVRKRSRNMLW